MTHKLKNLWDRYYGGKLEFRVRLFNILATAGGILSLYSVVGAVSDGWLHVSVCIFAAMVSFSLMVFATITGKYELCYIITIIMLFFGLFPLLFFLGGGFYGSRPFMLMLAVLFTVFMLKGRKALIFAIAETIIYIILFVVAFLFPEYVIAHEDELSRLFDICFGFALNSAAIGLCIYLHFRLYDRQQEMLISQNEKLGRINKQKSALLADVSHEIRTPLTIMSGYAQRARKQIIDGTVNEETLQGLLTIQLEAQRLSELAEQLIYSPLIGGQTTHSEYVKMYDIAEQTMTLLRPILEKNGNRLKLLDLRDTPPIYANAGMISQVLINLCLNSNRYTKDGEITITGKGISDGLMMFQVADNGTGINPELMPIIFERGVSGDGKSGLGLGICKEVIESHGGDISISSGVKGTLVSFTLPTERKK